jgi:hypothetical protein
MERSINVKPVNQYLIAASIGNLVAALLHLGCIIFGGDWYRFLGAGEQMAQMAEAGLLYPTMVTSVITAILLIFALYTLSGAGVIVRLPLLRLGLWVITAIYLLRGVSAVLLIPLFPDNSLTFWIISSLVCLTLGAVHFMGVKRMRLLQRK